MKIILCTHNGNERYIDLCVKVMSELWPHHPELIVFTDVGNFTYANKIVSPEDDWVPMMSRCLNQLVASGRLGSRDQILLLLEDHIPHADVNEKLIFQLGGFLEQHGNTYVNLAGHGKGRRVADGSCHDVYFMEWHAYSSLHPSIWSVDHISKTLSYAATQGITDPWQFERIRLSRVSHYTTGAAIWPSTHGGFLWMGKVNVPALKHFTSGSLLRLRRMLFLKLLIEAPSRGIERLRSLVGKR